MHQILEKYRGREDALFRKLEKKYGVKVSNFTACGILGSSGLILLALAWQVGGPSHNVDDRAAGPSDAARLDFRSEHFDAKKALQTPGLAESPSQRRRARA